MQNIEEYWVEHPHEFIASILWYYQNRNIQLKPEIHGTINDLLTDIYVDLDGISNVRIDVYITDTKDLAPSMFKCKFKEGKSVMIVTIKYDGKKESTFSRLHWWPKFIRCVREMAGKVFKCLKPIAKRATCTVIGGGIGFLTAGPVGLVVGACVGLVGGEKAVDIAKIYIERRSIQ
ncbi:uncharacterized protein [Mytilus edulis]|uniref:uncharacterized protein isoform X1 n=1 Tax=Mytilus edulis TaxID=6550 RepID=UPI0039EF0DF2